MTAFPLDKTAAFILTWPADMVSFPLVEWLAALGVPVQKVLPSYEDICLGHNLLVAAAMASTAEYFLFAENDIRPNVRDSALFLDLDGDVVACEYDCYGPDAWGGVDAFHSGLWRTSRATIERIQASIAGQPSQALFLPPYNADGTKLLRCYCSRFRLLALGAGLSVRHGGHAHHSDRACGRHQ